MQTDRFPVVRPTRPPWQAWARRVGTHGAALLVGAVMATSPEPPPIAPAAALPPAPPATVTAPPTTETVTAAPAPRAVAQPPAVKATAPRTAIEKATADAQATAPRTATEKVATYYANCAAAKRAGAAPLRSGQAGYRAGLDRDGDGVACET